jgi:hypothetical protein
VQKKALVQSFGNVVFAREAVNTESSLRDSKPAGDFTITDDHQLLSFGPVDICINDTVANFWNLAKSSVPNSGS